MSGLSQSLNSYCERSSHRQYRKALIVKDAVTDNTEISDQVHRKSFIHKTKWCARYEAGATSSGTTEIMTEPCLDLNQVPQRVSLLCQAPDYNLRTAFWVDLSYGSFHFMDSSARWSWSSSLPVKNKDFFYHCLGWMGSNCPFWRPWRHRLASFWLSTILES